MRKRIARVLDPAELGRNFGGGPQWQTARWDGLDFVGSTRFYEVELRAQDPLWHLSVEAADDPSDSEQVTTEDPVKALAEFLSRGLPGGGDFFKDRAAALRRLAALASSDRPLTPRGMRRALLAALAASDDLGLGDTDVVPTHRMPGGPGKGPSASGPDEAALVGGLLRRMRAKGWEVEQGETNWGAPLLKVDVGGGEYRAEVRVDSMPFSYRFAFKGRDDLTEEGVTDDPIREFKSWFRKPELEEAWEEANAAESPSPESQDAPTAAPPRR